MPRENSKARSALDNHWRYFEQSCNDNAFY